jgi:hypothetical protein
MASWVISIFLDIIQLSRELFLYAYITKLFMWIRGL